MNRCLFKIPMASRCLVFLLWLSGAHTPVQAQGTSPLVLSETEAVERALARPDVVERAWGEVQRVRGNAQAQGAYANPQLSYMREQTAGTFGTGEDYVTVIQTVDLGNRVGYRRRAGREREEAAKLTAEAERLAIAAETRRHFYTLIHHGLRQVALERWLIQVDEGLRVIAAREAQGDVAPYDRRRLERERVMVESLVEREHIAADTSRQRLGIRIGISPDEALALEASGTLLPDALPNSERHVNHPAQRSLAARERASLQEEHAARRLRIPDLRLEGGFKGVRLTPLGHSNGWMLGGTFQLPLADKGHGQMQAAAGEARALRAEQEALTRALDGDVATYGREATRYRQLAITQRAKATQVSADLLRMAQAGYAGGELSVLEVLDAYRGVVEDELAALEAEYVARVALIAWTEAQGRAVP